MSNPTSPTALTHAKRKSKSKSKSKKDLGIKSIRKSVTASRTLRLNDAQLKDRAQALAQKELERKEELKEKKVQQAIKTAEKIKRKIEEEKETIDERKAKRSRLGTSSSSTPSSASSDTTSSATEEDDDAKEPKPATLAAISEVRGIEQSYMKTLKGIYYTFLPDGKKKSKKRNLWDFMCKVVADLPSNYAKGSGITILPILPASSTPRDVVNNNKAHDQFHITLPTKKMVDGVQQKRIVHLRGWPEEAKSILLQHLTHLKWHRPVVFNGHQPIVSEVAVVPPVPATPLAAV
jgi:hypothetical protein